MPRALWNGNVIAESDNCQIVEGNVYFPADSIRKEYFQESPTQTVCSWKGTASYYTVVAGEEQNADAAWYYPEPTADAANIKGHVAFWRGVQVEK